MAIQIIMERTAASSLQNGAADPKNINEMADIWFDAVRIDRRPDTASFSAPAMHTVSDPDILKLLQEQETVQEPAPEQARQASRQSTAQGSIGNLLYQAIVQSMLNNTKLNELLPEGSAKELYQSLQSQYLSQNPEQITGDTGKQAMLSSEELIQLFKKCEQSGELEQDIDGFAALFAQLSCLLPREGKNTGVKTPYMGNPYETLRQVFQRTVHRYAKKAVEDIVAFFERGGKTGMKKQFTDSIQGAAEDRALQYQYYIKNTPAASPYTGGRLPNAKELMNQISQLRKGFHSCGFTALTPQKGLYSLREVAAVRTLAEHFSAVFTPPSGTGSVKNEEMLGFELGFAALKADAAARFAGLDTSLTQSVDSAFRMNLASYLDKLDEILRLQSMALPKANQGFAPLQRDAIEEVIRRMLFTFRKSDSVQKAVMQGLEYVRKTSEEKSKSRAFSKLLRYSDCAEMIEAFLDGAKGSPVLRRRNGCERMREDWNGFVKSLGLKQAQLYWLHRSLYDNGFLEMLLPHFPANSMLTGLHWSGLLMWSFLLFLLPYLLQIPLRYPSNPAFYPFAALSLVLGTVLLALMIFSFTGGASRRAAGVSFKVWRRLLLLDVYVFLGATTFMALV